MIDFRYAPNESSPIGRYPSEVENPVSKLENSIFIEILHKIVSRSQYICPWTVRGMSSITDFKFSRLRLTQYGGFDILVPKVLVRCHDN